MPDKPTNVRQYRNEINRSAMALISPVKTWDTRERKVDVIIGDRRYKVEARSAYNALPHGIDSDVLTAVITLALENGLPDNNTLRTTPYELLKTAMMSVGGREYERLRESLLRLAHATYIIRDGWYDATRQRWRFANETYRLIDKVTWRDEEDLNGYQELVADGELTVRLNEDLAEQLKAGYVHLPDPSILRALRDAPARGLYYFLEGQRERLRLETGVAQTQLQFDLASLAELLGLGSAGKKPIPGNIRRSLNDMSDALIEAHYLTSMTIEGRGMRASLTFTFPAQDIQPVVDASLVQNLIEEGLPAASARQLALKYPNNIPIGIRIYRSMLHEYAAKGRRPRDGRALLAAAIRTPEKYAVNALLTHEPTHAASEAVMTPPTLTPKTDTAFAGDDYDRRMREEWASLDLESTTSRFVNLLKYAGLTCSTVQAHQLVASGTDLFELSSEIARTRGRGDDSAPLLQAALDQSA